ncbi:DUF917 domain-containing protein [Halioglobus maricola]|uniref:DUF917 domain-containing protein n=1 Tax=Halioglobus maricola TaxID=2601894 RepID=A0A5P9NI65_9GAMM|nr:DUF917 domain-containing protein [Halioglobus maricola]QFU75239.1 DUF917 domain-containing protein [Halioglobus maricola]
MKKFGRESLADLSAGAVFLATGGGGDPYVAELVAQQALEKYGSVDLIDPENLDDDAYVVAIGGVGAPTVSLELLPSIDEAVNTLRAFEDRVGRKVDAVVSFEIGGGNSLIPIVAGAVMGIPVVDGDGMGRALPEAQMMTYPISGVSPTPAVATDYQGTVTEFHTKDIMEFEKEIRQCALSSGGMITSAEHPMTGKQLKAAIVPGTVSFSIELGRLLRKYRGNAHRIYEPLAELFSGSIYGDLFHLYTGKVIDSSTRIVGGYDIGAATIAPFDGSGAELTISIKNEYLAAEANGKVIASVPDLITIVDYETSTPINAERLRYGQRVTVFGVGCPSFYRTQRALEFVAPSCFGFPFEYKTIEELNLSN